MSFLSHLGLGYALATALAFLVLFSALLLASYLCFHHHNPSLPSSPPASLPPPSRVIFVADDDDSDDPSHSPLPGLDQAAINSYPKFPFDNNTISHFGSNSVCSICLCEYRDGEMLRMMPDCRHCFHLTCVDAWLRLNASCPVCRTSPMPTPLSTPLSELVPLSQYAGDRRRR